MSKANKRAMLAFVGVLAALVGCEGAAGLPGADGPPGAPGMNGSPGTDGARGAAGADGIGGLVGPPGDPGDPAVIDLLNAGIVGWLPENRTALNALITSRGRTSPTFDPMHPPVAVFDWDNTVLKNDIGDATFFWMINNDKILQPPGRDWSLTNSALTPAARAALNANCDALAAPGAPLPTGAGTAGAILCADTLYHIYNDGVVGATGSAAAWTSAITLTTNQPYAWVAQLMAGYRPSEIRQFARYAFDENNWAPIGATQTVGSISATGYVRIYEAIDDLIDALQYAGFDVWVVSASPQYAVEEVAAEVNVQRDHVIGIRSVLTAPSAPPVATDPPRGLITYNVQGCGTVADGANTLITFDVGKRCWINKVIFHIPAATQMDRAPLAQRAVFAAGDSDTDIAMIKDATDLKLVINRGKTQIMCNAYAGMRSRWLIQPMFISPRACRTTAFTCDTALDAAGMPIVDETGVVFPPPPPAIMDTICTLP